jgi:hypothetical protein
MADRNTIRKEGPVLNFKVAADTLLEAGKMGAVNQSGYAIEAADSTTVAAVIGRIDERVDNTGGADGDKSVSMRRGVFSWDNDGTGDGMISLPGKVVYVKDDQTVSASTGTAAVHAGHSLFVDDNGVWVDHDFE